MMDKAFATYGYKNPKSYSFSFDRFTTLYFIIVSTIFLVIVTQFKLSFPDILFPVFLILVLSVIIYNSIINRTRKIIIGNRYIIEGRSIIYFENLKEVTINHRKGAIILKTPKNSMIIQRIYFPTESKKEHKIAISQRKKFTTISRKINAKVAEKAPSVKVTIINSRNENTSN